MKKIFTLFLFTAIVALSFAQNTASRQRYGDENDFKRHDGWYDNGRDKGSYYFSRRDMQAEINEINRFYDQKTEAVKCNWYIRGGKKHRILNEIECKRDEEIKEVYLKFKNPCNRFNNYDNHRNW